jgi:hypothetical protein
MRASGVALTGAQATLKAWSEGKVPDPQDDGILTAEEVSGLNLDGTWLVTLSACESGVGEAKSGEGVFGLRRAFMMAGAQNLLMTLWPVNDDTTAKIMADFYKKALANGDAAGSLSEVQRDWLVKLRNEKGLLPAVRDAGPFAMVVMANPNAKPQPEPSAQNSPAAALSESPLSGSTPRSSGSEVSTPSPTLPVQAGGRRILELEEALSLADEGDAYAQGVVSIYYTMGYKVPKDAAKGLTYALKSAAQKNPLGTYQVGALRELGVGMKKDKTQAHKLMSEAFDGLNTLSGDPYALYDLGYMALSGIEVDQNPKEAARLFKTSADLGYAPAQKMYALLLEKGVGVPQDPEQSAKYKQDYLSQWPAQ